MIRSVLNKKRQFVSVGTHISNEHESLVLFLKAQSLAIFYFIMEIKDILK